MIDTMTVTHRIAEARLKAAVIDRLFASSHVDGDAVLISEMTVANWSRRADLVLANGCLWGFEIKSEVDSLARLPGQLDTFRTHFEKLTLVVASRFEAKVSATIPDGVGLWVANADGVLVERVRPKLAALSPKASVSLMTADELRKLVASNCEAATSNMRRAELVELALRIPSAELATAARQAVKARHRCRHEALVSAKAGSNTLAAITSRQGAPTTSPGRSLEGPAMASVTIPDNHPDLVMAPVGPILRRRPAHSSVSSSSPSPVAEKSEA